MAETLTLQKKITAVVCGLITLQCIGCKLQNATNSAYNQASRVGTYVSEDVFFLIGVEKFHCEKLGYNAANDRRFRPADETTHRTLARDFPSEIPKLNRNINDFLPKPSQRAMVVSHLVMSTEDKQLAFPYNIRQMYLNAPGSQHKLERAHENGETAVRKLCENQIKSVISRANSQGKPFTHVIVMTMGWVNDQEEAVMRFRSVASQLRKAHENQNSRAFRPLVIGVSWPSGWLTNSDLPPVQVVGHIGSYFNKANDADELGYRVISPFIHHHLPKAIPRSIPIIAIGHSFGARALTRAVHSAPLLTEAPKRHVDLLISIQPAVSLRRWLPGEGLEGAPYAIDHLPRHCIISSENDHANETAFWAINGGQKAGIEISTERPGRLRHGKWNSTTMRIEPTPNRGTVPLVVDASEIVKEGRDHDPYLASKKARSGHNDMLDAEMGKLLYYAIQNLR